MKVWFEFVVITAGCVASAMVGFIVGTIFTALREEARHGH